jgi:hypothetical protein
MCYEHELDRRGVLRVAVLCRGVLWGTLSFIGLPPYQVHDHQPKKPDRILGSSGELC